MRVLHKSCKDRPRRLTWPPFNFKTWERQKGKAWERPSTSKEKEPPKGSSFWSCQDPSHRVSLVQRFLSPLCHVTRGQHWLCLKQMQSFVLTEWQDQNKAAVKAKLLLLWGSLFLKTLSKCSTKEVLCCSRCEFLFQSYLTSELPLVPWWWKVSMHVFSFY